MDRGIQKRARTLAQQARHFKSMKDVLAAWSDRASPEQKKFLAEKLKGHESLPLFVRVQSTYTWSIQLGDKFFLLHFSKKKKNQFIINSKIWNWQKESPLENQYVQLSENLTPKVSADSKSRQLASSKTKTRKDDKEHKAFLIFMLTLANA